MGGWVRPKTDEGVPLAAENWTQKIEGKMEFGAKKIDSQKIVSVLVLPKRSSLIPRMSKKWGQNGGTSIFLNIEGVSLPPG